MSESIYTILITGDMGFIGKRLTSCLQISNKVIGYDLQRGEDIGNKYQLWKMVEMSNPDVVIHLAALTGVRNSKYFSERYIATNINGTQNVLEVCEEFKIKKFIFFSSSSVFGNTSPPVVESSVKNPISIYGITKLAGEHLVLNSKVPSVIVRPFTVYGENGREDSLIWRWIKQIKKGKPLTIYGDGRSCRGYVYIMDLIQIISKLIQIDWEWDKEDFNIGGSEVIYLKDVLRIFKEIYPNISETWLPLPEGDIYQQYADIEKARDILGFNPGSKFLEEVKEYVKG